MARTNIPLDPTRTGLEAKRLENDLQGLVVGQEEAIEQVVSLYQAYLTGMNTPGRPIGNLLFLGPTGSGKTRMVEATAECLVKNPRAVIKIDCGEFQHSHEIAKLVGSPPGYLGHRETHAVLSQEALNQYHTETVKITFVLFDEIEKATDALWNLLLGVLDKATLALGDNRKVDFSRTMVFMTSNLGASEMNALLSPKLGFAAPEPDKQVGCGETDRVLDRKMARSAVEAARRKFTPEFINRLDKIVTFKPLGSEQLRRILDIELKMVQQRIFNAAPERSFLFEVTGPAKDLLLNEGTDMNTARGILSEQSSGYWSNPSVV
jgi:ATP-dependent Clp protease ATP-binding subunit ClpB